MPTAYYNDLDAAWQHAWEQLARGCADRRHGFHLAQLATVDAEGAPDLRSVILRAADVETTALRVHSDARSTKCAQLAADGRAALLVYDARRKLQLRIRGRISLHGDDATAEAAWQAAKPMSRVCYRIEPGPGTAIATPDGYRHPEPATDATDPGREHFRVLLLQAESLEWLYLAADGHRRARWQQSNGWRGEWLAP